MHFKTTLAGLLAATMLAGAGSAQAETLRLLTWGSYAPDELIEKFEAEYPDIDVEVTFSNNEEMIAKLRATGGAGFDLAQPSHDRIYAAQLEYDIYKPLDLSKIDTSVMEAKLLDGVKENTTIEGEVYAVPHQWGTSGLMADKTKAPDLKSWADLCNPAYEGKTSMRLKRTILLGTAFSMGEDPFAAYSDLDKYQGILDKVAEKLIECKGNIKAYWKGGDDLSAMMLSGEIVGSETWDSTAYKLFDQNENIVFVPPKEGALAWIDTFALPRKAKADDAAYKWINFVMRPEVAAKITASAGNFTASKGADDFAEDKLKAQFKASFPPADLDNIKWYPPVPAGLETIEGKVLDRVKAAKSN